VVTSYKPLFHIRCRHGYFADQVCRPLRLSPTPLCSRLLERHGCLFRQTDGGGSVYFATAPDGTTPLRLFDETTPFAFALTGPAAQITSFTEIDPAAAASPSTSLYSFNNREEQVATFDGEECLLLHPPGAPFASAAVPVRPPRFVHRFAKPVRAAAVQVSDMLRNKVFDTRTPAQETSALPVDLSRVPEGRYRLTVNNRDPVEFYLSVVAPAARWGMIEIFAGGPAMKGLPKRCRVLGPDGTPGPPATFVLALEPRRSIWRYYVVSQNSADRTYDGYGIAGGPPRGAKANGNGTIAFSAPAKQKINGKDVWIFESAAAIPIFEQPGDRHEFTLKNNAKGGGGAGPFTLPYAQPDTTRLLPGPDGKPRNCSEIFVYL
jgi:hypothetical protein